MDRAELERLDRESLVLKAQAAGIRRARVLTRPELVDELLRLDPAIDPQQLKKTRGFFGRARDLLSKVVERGLHLPDAADRLRAALGNPLPQVPRPEPQAVPTVTLAEIYAAQGHKVRAVETLRRVLEAEPDHGAARALLEKLEAADYVAPPPPLPPEPEQEERLDEVGGILGDLSDVFEDDVTIALPGVVAAAPSVVDPMAKTQAAPELRPETSASTEPPELDECIAIPVDGGTFVWWRLSQTSRRLAGESFFFVRALVIVPSWDGPLQTSRDIAADPDAFELLLRGLPERAIVRIAIGFIDSGTFVPVAHSPAIEVSSESAGLVRWTPEGSTPISLDDPDSASIAQAAARAAGANDVRDPAPRHGSRSRGLG